MNRTQFSTTTVLTLVMLPDAALAHLGHAGEQAGHSHWLGLAALAAAIIALALLRRPPAKSADAVRQADEAKADRAASGNDK